MAAHVRKYVAPAAAHCGCRCLLIEGAHMECMLLIWHKAPLHIFQHSGGGVF